MERGTVKSFGLLRMLPQRLGLRAQVQVFSLLFVLLLLSVGGGLYYHLVQRALRGQYHQALQSYAARLGTAVGLLGVDLNALTPEALERVRPLFMEPLLGDGSYPMVVHPSGRIVLHFFREGEYFPMEVMERMASAPDRKGEFLYYFTDAASSARLVVFAYAPHLRCFLAVETQPMKWGVTLTSNRLFALGVLILLVALFLTFLFSSYFGIRLSRFVDLFSTRLRLLSRGEMPGVMEEQMRTQEVKQLIAQSNALSDGLVQMENFAVDITANRLDAEYTPRGPSDRLGHALLSLRDSLRASAKESAQRHQEEEVRNWTNQGLAEIATLLRERGADIEELSYAIMEHLVGYLHAQQGSLYLLDSDALGGQGSDSSEGGRLHLVMAYAYNRRKYLQSELAVGEGLVGTCARERATIHLDRVPPEYFDITSGVGGVPPRELLLVPLKTADAFLGVLELASLDPFLPHMVSFVEALSASIAQTLQSTRNALQTQRLLEESQMRREQLHAQEEEMRQNLEEMKATQEEMERNSEQSRALQQTIDRSALFGVFNGEGVCLSLNEPFTSLLARAGIASGEGWEIQPGCLQLQGAHEGVRSLKEAWPQLLEEGLLQGCFTWSGSAGSLQCAVGTFTRHRGDIDFAGYGPEGNTIFFLGNEFPLELLGALEAIGNSEEPKGETEAEQ